MKNKNKIKKSSSQWLVRPWQKTSKKVCLPTRRGFSLVEMIVAVFLFSLVMVMLAGTFATFLKSAANGKKIQRDIENAQYAINLIAKTLRTSAVVATNTFPLDSFDYSQGKCIRYNYSGNKIQMANTTDFTPAKISDCTWGSIIAASYVDLTPNSIVSAAVAAIPTDMAAVPVVLGKVTVSLSVQSGTLSAIPIQTTVSLRQ